MASAIDLQLRSRVPSSLDRDEAIGHSLTPPPPRSGRTAIIAALVSLVAWVGIPSLLASVYLFAFAANQYTAQAQFVVRGSTNPVGGEFTGNFASLIAINSSQDSFIAADIISSGSVADRIDKERSLKDIFSKPQSDPFSGLSTNATDEDLMRYWPDMISAHVEPISGVVVVEARAFSPDDAAFLADRLVHFTEQRINEMHSAYLQQSADLTAEQVKVATSRLAKIRAELKAFREQNRVIDMAAGASSSFATIAELRRQRIGVRAALAVSRSQGTSNTPANRVLQKRLAALDQQIQKIEAELTGATGGDATTVAAALESYDALIMRETVADEFYVRAVAAENKARLRASQRDIYLDVFVKPQEPEESRLPHRWSVLGLVLSVAFGLWIVARLLYASTMDHEA